MKRITLFLIACFIVKANNILAQSLLAIPKSNSITVTKERNIELNIPIEIDFINSDRTDLTKIITLRLDNSKPDSIKQFNPSTQLSLISIINNNQSLSIAKNETKKTLGGFYIRLDSSLTVFSDKILNLDIISDNKILNTIKINIDPGNITLTEYMDTTKHIILDEVFKVESTNNVLTIHGYKEHPKKGHSDYLKRKIALERGEVYAIINNEFGLYKPKVSLSTIPFKVRPKEGGFHRTATAGLTNIGLQLDFLGRNVERYFATGKKSTKRYGFGVWVAPSIEELDSTYTEGFLKKDEKSKQLFGSLGLTITYIYNDLAFIFVPVGFDFATSSVGRKWVYNKQNWWGFGLAISPKFFATIDNK